MSPDDPTPAGHDPSPDPRRGTAIAVWVKTPGWSPVKTRLASAIGTAAAEAFYAHAVAAVAEVVAASAEHADEVTPYWAVAESEPAAIAEWTRFAVVAQGEGGLGERLARVYEALLARHARVLFIGADAPQLAPTVLVEAAGYLMEDAPGGGMDFVLGPAADGGFYVFGGRRTVPWDTWTAVPYSDAGTLAALSPRLAEHGTLATLPEDFDVDTVTELMALGDVLAARASGLLPSQRALLTWIGTGRWR